MCRCSVDDDFSVVFDTGAELERTMARQLPAIFNADAGNTDQTPEESFDRRSDNRVRHCRRQVLSFACPAVARSKTCFVRAEQSSQVFTGR